MDVVTVENWLSPLRERDLIPDDVLAALVVGSAARGWHNLRSDFDICVVTRDARVPGCAIPVPLVPAHVRTVSFYAFDRQWDVTYWLDSQVDQVFDKVSWDAFDGGEVTQDVLSVREELLLGRLSSGLTLVGEDWHEHRRANLAESAFRSFVVVRSLCATGDAVEDALGQLEAGDLQSATVSARTAFGHVVDAILESSGEYGSHLPKWRPNRMKAVRPPILDFADYWRIETMQGYDPDEPRGWITSLLTLVQDLAMRVETT